MTSAWPSRLAWTSSSMPWPAAIAASNAPRLFSGTPGPCSPRWAKGRAISSASLSGLDRNNGVHLDRGAERQHRHADRAARVPPRFAEHPLHQFRSAVGDLGLVGEGRGAVDEHAELDHPLDAVERPQSRLHLGDQHHRAALGGLAAALDVMVLAEPAGDQAALGPER